jgi:hypothetical protein
MTPRSALLASLLVLLAIGCADDIEPADDDPADDDPADDDPARVATERNDDGSYTTRIDATSMTAWTLADLETGVEVAEDAPWDLSTQRFELRLNGGVGGDGGVEVVRLADVALDDVVEVPTDGWITDQPDGDDEGDVPDYAFAQGGGWYAYDAATHVLTPLPVVWVLRTVEGAVVKLAIEDYYDDAGTAGHFTLRWAPLAAARSAW